MKEFYDQLSVEVEEEVILAAQIIDYLDEGLLIKRDSYERMGREMLGKQVRNKFAKYFWSGKKGVFMISVRVFSF